ncbi:hypothetical protein [Polaromonas naphthalenivorans]|uniref:hypothetical protein n=1 Tax=Polaromonas naphthalenivorans TaxID=216465 RepID=UPI0012ED4514|nr:hypothetical protein [Polaromonas naphthalenivorans]
MNRGRMTGAATTTRMMNVGKRMLPSVRSGNGWAFAEKQSTEINQLALPEMACMVFPNVMPR